VDVETVITQLGVGEALVSLLDEKGMPGIVERAFIYPPQSQIGPIDPGQRQEIIRQSLLYGQYEKTMDRESAYELLQRRVEKIQEDEAKTEIAKPKGRQPDSLLESVFKSTTRAMGSQIGRSIIRGVLGSIFGSRR
jgi:hypothetical protein